MTTARSGSRSPAGLHGARRAFTLIELLIVIGIIGILISLALAVGFRVASAGREQQSLETIKSLDVSLTEYIAVTGGNPPPLARDPRPRNNDGSSNLIYYQPVADARAITPSTGGSEPEPMINSVGLYMSQAKGLPSVEAIFRGLDARIVRETDVDGPKPPQQQPDTDYTNQWPVPTALDGWGRPIRYVHPKFHGLVTANPSQPDGYVMTNDPLLLGPEPSGRRYGIVQIRRNNVATGNTGADSDGGMCAGGRPYFYSAGPDGDPSTLEDNVYLVRPQVQKF